MKKITLCTLIFLTSCFHLSISRENKGLSSNKPTINSTAFGCPNTTAQTDLSINNVRAHILNGGDLWWDYNNNTSGQYEIPNGSGKISIYAGAVWVGGYDAANNLKMAAQTYRQSGGNDFWSGPISKDVSGTLDVTTATCSAYDRFWKLNKTDVVTFAGGGASTPDILSWPGNGNVANGELPFLAPFFDANNNSIYEPLAGDYPKYDLTGSIISGCDEYLQGDQTIWWVFNDIGNIHTETNSLFSIGLEIRAQAFAFSSSITAVNNSTFYKYQIINRSSDPLLNTYFGVWCDADLGNALDDYVGCDVNLGLGYCYNGDANDDLPDGYGLNPPAIGIDFFQGPLADPGDGIDNDRDGTTDEPGELIMMSNFIYYVNTNGVANGNPALTDDYYQYLSGFWLDGVQVTYGGDGRGSGPGATTNPCSFMFPGTTDLLNTTNWTMSTAAIPPGDMRFIESAGKFTMAAGAVNYISTGVVWARATSGGPAASLALLQAEDFTIQNLFNSCFTSSINEQSAADSYTLYPNPCVNYSILKFNNAEGRNMTLKIYNINGKVVQQLSNIVNSEVRIDSRKFEKGIYIFQLTDNKESKISGKLTVL